MVHTQCDRQQLRTEALEGCPDVLEQWEPVLLAAGPCAACVLQLQRMHEGQYFLIFETWCFCGYCHASRLFPIQGSTDWCSCERVTGRWWCNRPTSALQRIIYVITGILQRRTACCACLGHSAGHEWVTSWIHQHPHNHQQRPRQRSKLMKHISSVARKDRRLIPQQRLRQLNMLTLV